MIEQQREKLLKLSDELYPGLTWDDLLQPNDFPLLERHPEFRYEEGILAGLQSARIACLAEHQK
jgi:hypothetical protein